MQRIIGVFTPIKHLPEVFSLVAKKADTLLMSPHASGREVLHMLQNSDINTIICNPNKQTYKFDEHILINSQVKTIVTCSTGLSHIDMEYCERNGIEVLSLTTDLNVITQLPSTAELAFILMGNLLRKIPQSTESVRRGTWDYEPFVGRQIKDLNIGIVGYGRLGKMMETYCSAFGANTKFYDPYVVSSNLNRTDSLEEMFAWADVISLHVHLNEETRYMINDDLLSIPTKDLYLINTSRGNIVDEWAVLRALESGKLTGYATDVLAHEGTTHIRRSPILECQENGENVIVTPHIGGMTWEGQNLAYKAAINKL